MFPAIFLDRDGVIIENRPNYVRSWSEVDVLPCAVPALTQLTAYKIVIVTNQSAVGRGLLPIETAQLINQQLREMLRQQQVQIEAVYMCPHRPEDQCECRKPQPGMLRQAARDLDLDLQRSWMIGDAWSDLLAGQAAGVRRLALVRTGRGREQLRLPRPTALQEYFIFNDLAAAVSAILKPDAVSPNLQHSS